MAGGLIGLRAGKGRRLKYKGIGGRCGVGGLCDGCRCGLYAAVGVDLCIVTALMWCTEVMFWVRLW